MRNFRKILTISIMMLCLTGTAMAWDLLLKDFKYASGSPDNPTSVPETTAKQYAAMECMQTAALQKASLRQGYFSVTDGRPNATCFRDGDGTQRISSGVCMAYAPNGGGVIIHCEQVTH